MTYKHVKFEDSPTMRSLIKVAHEKGLIKENSIVKTASLDKSPDYTPSGNLMENVLKLCSGLRNSGLEKFANELESKFIDYKRAFSIYETSKETGDDVIDQAHPDGSHKISDVEGDAVVETILDQHLKMINIINKTPNGKLASHKDILNSVKKVVAQKVSLQDSLKNMLAAAQMINKIYSDIGFLAKPLLSSAIENLLKAANEAFKNVSEDNLNYVLTASKKARADVSTGLLGGLSSDDWSDLEPYFNKLEQHTKNAIREINNPTKVELPVDENTLAINNEVSNIRNTLKAWTARINTDPENSEADKKEALSWVDRKLQSAENIKKSFSELDPGAKSESFDLLMRNLQSLKQDFPEFKKTWIG